MKTITKIEANRSAAVHRKCRVAAYCRVFPQSMMTR